MNTPTPPPQGRWLARTLLVLLVTAALPGLAADRTWTGTTSTLWNVGSNWGLKAPPAPGDNLFFPAGILQPSTTFNNYPAGTAFGKLTIAEASFQGYVLNGAAIRLNGGIAMTGNQASSPASIGLDLTLGTDQVFSATRVLSLGGRVELGGHKLTLSPSSTGTVLFRGTVTDTAGTGSISKTNAGTAVIAAGARVSVGHIGVGLGTLRVDGAVTNAAGTATVSVEETTSTFVSPTPGSTVLEGSGVVDVAEIHDTLSPGGNGPGILRCHYLGLQGFGCGILCGKPAGTLRTELNGTVPGSTYDQVEVYSFDLTGEDFGQVRFSPGKLDIRVGYEAQEGDFFHVLKVLPGNPFNKTTVGGFFAGLPPMGIQDSTNGYSFVGDYTNGLVLRTVRTPNSPFLLWKGFGNGSFYGDRLWSTPNNWGGGVVPSEGARLRFTENQFRGLQKIFNLQFFSLPPASTNDLPAGTSLASLFLSGTNHILSGNGIALTEGITNRASDGTNHCLLDISVVGSIALDVSPGGNLVLGGAFSGGGTATKQGGGELRYTGLTENSFFGEFVLNGGVLRVDGSLLDGSMSVNVGLLCGTGTVASVAMTGGTLNPGNGPGVLRIREGLSLGAGAVFQAELNGATPGSGYDQVQVVGSVDLTGSTLDVRPGLTFPVGTAFLLLINDGSDAITGTFAGLPEGAIFTVGGQSFSISYKAGTGRNDVALTRVSTPARLTGVTQLTPGTVEISGAGGNNAIFTIQVSTNLPTTNWINLGVLSAGPTGLITFKDTNVLFFPRRFFRLSPN